MKIQYKYFLLLILSSCSLLLSAQTTIGAKAGVNLGTFSNNGDSSEINADLKRILGLQIGGLAEITINENIAIQTEFLFIQKGFRVSSIDTFTQSQVPVIYKSKTKFVVNYLEVPILLKYKFGDPEEVRMFATVGPTFSYAAGAFNVARVTALGNTDRMRQPAELDDLLYNRFEVSASLGVGFSVPVDPGELFFEARAQFGLTNLNERGGRDKANYNRGFGFTMGYLVNLSEVED